LDAYGGITGRWCEQIVDGFSVVCDDAGHRQVLPLSMQIGQTPCVRLIVRRYFGYDGCSGGAELALTRMVALWHKEDVDTNFYYKKYL